MKNPDLLKELQSVILGEYTTKIGSGSTPRGGANVYLDSGEISLIRSQNVHNDGFKSNGLVYITDDAAKKLDGVTIEENDILLNITGDSVARVCLVPKWVLPARVNQHVAIIRVQPNEFDSRYVRYYLSSPIMQDYLLGLAASGATRNALTKVMIEKLEVQKPELSEQKRIADILSSLDDKIALNREMNKTLEAMAQAIFKSWFVDFEPLKEGEFVESELGMIPKGWEVKPLPELIELNPRYSLKKGSEASYLDMANIPTDNARVNEVVVREFSSGSKFMNGDTLLARITPSLENGKTAFVDFLEEDEIGWGSTEFIVMRAKNPLPKEFTYFLARTDDFRSFAISNMAGTSGRQRVPNDCFEQYLMILPDVDTCKKFGEFASSVIKKMQGNDLESKTLSTLRDTLLPKLLSGEIGV